MSTRISFTFPRILFIAAFSIISVGGLAKCAIHAQVRSVAIEVITAGEPRVSVEAESGPSRTWSFPDSYAGTVGLGERVVGLKAFGTNGVQVSVRQIAPGQFKSTEPATRFTYLMKLSPPLNPMDTAKVSWISDQRGLLMLRDLVPALEPRPEGQAISSHQPQRLRVTMKVPDGWRYFGNDWNGGADFDVSDYDTAVFAIGSNLRVSQRRIQNTTLSVILDGQWSFTDNEVLDLIAKIYSAHRATFHSSSAAKATLVLFPFPRPASPTLWTAETRGETVMLLSGTLPSKVGALAQLSTPLTHELFHLWVPNALALDGDYDWFYEGFTVYEAARTAVRLDLLTFPELLNAISRAYDGYLNSGDQKQSSLVEASRARWANQSSVYSKSMVVAFLYDLQLRIQSRGKHSLEDIYPSLIERYGNRAGADEPARLLDANEAVTAVLGFDDASRAMIKRLVMQPATIDLKQELLPYGLQVETFGFRTRISVADQLSKQERDLLRQLGYNDAARNSRHRN